MSGLFEKPGIKTYTLATEPQADSKDTITYFIDDGVTPNRTQSLRMKYPNDENYVEIMGRVI